MSRFFEKRYNVEDRELIYEEEQYQQKETTANKNRNKTRKMHENYRTSSSGSDVECRDSQKCIRPVLRAPTPPPVVRRIVERAPTPEQDVIERTIVRPQPQQLIERIIERPRTPPPRIIYKEICEPAPPTIVRTRIYRVGSSPRLFRDDNYAQQASLHGSEYTYSSQRYSHDDDYARYPRASRYESKYKYDDGYMGYH